MRLIQFFTKKKYLIVVKDTYYHFINKCSKLGIKIINVKIIKNDLIKVTVDFENKEKITKYILNDYAVLHQKLNNKIFFKKIYMAFFIVMSLLVLYGSSYFIFKVEILTDDAKIKNIIKRELYRSDIRIMHLKKDYETKEKIKKAILKDNYDLIEWMEIRSVGNNIYVDVVKKVARKEEEKKAYCGVFAKKDALIKKIYYKQGELLVNTNDYVLKDQLLISGDILKNEDIVNQVCANGTIYGEVWYKVKLALPVKEELSIPLKKYRYNIMYNNKNILKSRVKSPSVNTVYELGPFKINEEHFIEKKLVTYSEEELVTKALNLTKEKLSVNLGKDIKILEENVLKKEVNDSKMEIEIFVIVEENISAIKELEKEPINDS